MSKLLHPLSLSPLAFFFFTISMAAQLDLKYPNCPVYNCSGVPISYPFYKIDNQTTNQSFCGYEGFGINCSTFANGNRAIISLPRGDSYYVDFIDYVRRSLVLVDIDAAAPGDNCPRVRHNIDLLDLPLNFSSLNLNLSFHFNCTQIAPFATPLPCLRSGPNRSCVHILEAKGQDFDWDRYCDDQVVTTVLETGIRNRDRLAVEFGGALGRGFELNWQSMEDCGVCEDSDGRCGWNLQTKRSMCFCSDGSTTTDHCKGPKSINWKKKLAIGIGAAGAAMGSIILINAIYYVMKPSSNSCIRSLKYITKDDKDVEAFITQFGSMTTKRYNYVDIKKMTNSFQIKLGEGGFGSVFKGKLVDGRLVAVKVLNSSKANGKEFVNEVASIGRTSHVNVVTLLGFCYEGQKRALIYEFMPNGSLEKFIFRHVPLSTDERLGVNKLYEIALGIARGLDYLHRGCNTRILHLDIKPHNILLDEDFCPKIADFGLAKLYSRKESIVSMLEARGTIGYIAPEVFNRNFGGVSHKSDVYSYGMMILEMVGGRQNIDAGVGSGKTSEMYFPNWIYNRLEKEDMLLEGLVSAEENDFARKMIIVGLWCIQIVPSQRPSIDEVIEMLEGSMEALKVPPKPFFSSPPRSPATTCSTSHSVLV